MTDFDKIYLSILNTQHIIFINFIHNYELFQNKDKNILNIHKLYKLYINYKILDKKSC